MQSSSSDCLDLEPAYPELRRKRLRLDNSIDRSSVMYQRKAWKDLKKYFTILIKSLNADNVVKIKDKLLKRNIVRGKGLFCSAILDAQLFSTKDSNLYAILVSLVNLEFPNIGELLLTRCIWQLKAGYQQNIACVYFSTVIFISRLIDHGVADVTLAISVINLLLKFPTNNGFIEAGIFILKECGKKLNSLENRKSEIEEIYSKLRYFSTKFPLGNKLSDKIDTLLVAKANNFLHDTQSTTTIDSNQVIHNLCFDDIVDPCDSLDNFELDLDYIANEKLYKLQTQKPKPILTLSYAHDSDDADDEEEIMFGEIFV